jgi:hypothetical protein
MAYDKTQDFAYAPNSSEILNQGATYDESKYGTTADRSVGLGEMGVGSLWKRSVQDIVHTYLPWDFSFDTMVDYFGRVETVTHGQPFEWIERDLFLKYNAEGILLDATDVINNTTGSNTYVPAGEARFIVSNADAKIFKPFDVIRYESASGYVDAVVLSIEVAGANTALNLKSTDGTNLPVADANDAQIQFMGTNLPQEEEYDPQPRQSDPATFYTYVENPRREIKVTRHLQNLTANGAAFVDFINHYRDQLMANFRRDREVRSLTGSGKITKIELASGDFIQYSAGVYNQIKAVNQHTSDFKTGTAFNTTKFKNAIHNFVLFNFAGESGAPDTRALFVDGQMASYFDRAWDDIQRFDGNEFIAGVSVRRYQSSNGNMDITTVKHWSEIHPLKRAGIRNGGTTKAIGMLVPLDSDHIVRVQEEGFAPMEDIFYLKGGDRNPFYRLESKEGVAIQLPQHSAVLEEIPDAD